MSTPVLSRDRSILTFMLLMTTALAFCMITSRIVYVGTPMYAFQYWNLFLAWIPFGLANVVEHLHRQRGRPIWTLLAVSAWLLFLPNAPYLVTEFIHLSERGGAPIWYDSLMLMSNAWIGVMLGLCSLFIVHRMIDERFGAAVGWCAVFICNLLCGFGIYLGRFPRWNSWNILSHPTDLIFDIADRILNPLSHPRTWGVTILFATFLSLAYLTLAALVQAYRTYQPCNSSGD